MKIVITGGHLSPALAVIEKIPKDWEILFIGRKFALEGDKSVSLEYQTVNDLGIKFVDINAGRLQRSFSRYTIPSILRIPKAYITTLNVLRELKPDAILGFGGYVSVPVVIVGKMLNIPTVIHEQTLNAGASNKILSKFADKILISWETSFKYFPKEKTELIGNPVREDFFKPTNLPEGSDPLIFVFGGSTGSHTLNTLIEKIVRKLLKSYRVLHMTGPMDYERLSVLSRSLSNSNKYLAVESFNPFCMGYVLQNSEMVISRSGINTITELIKFEKPAILIPLPFGQKNEQEKNARFLKELGLAEVLDQKTVTPDALFEVVQKMFLHLDKYKLRKKGVLRLGASEKILEALKDATNKKTKKTK
ncbi:MAG: UDP-N-acetylglucosamine--N-acetylmuramyl-(pentapeptide) pyrophosphoryl-undecaprenol N-acetylglucosamine transferase [Patescibacteria group bacterium]